MKKKDLVIIFFVCVVSAVLSIIISGLLITPAKDRQQTIEVAPVISAELLPVDSRYFNANSINPAKDITIGRDPNSNPFAPGQ